MAGVSVDSDKDFSLLCFTNDEKCINHCKNATYHPTGLMDNF
jgi:hypothetical protein